MNQIKVWDWIRNGNEPEGGSWQLKQTLTCKSTSKLDKLRGTGDTHTIKSLALAPDDSFLAVGSVDKDIHIYQTTPAWDLKETQCIESEAGMRDKEIGILAISPDGKLLVAATEETGEEIFVYKIGDKAKFTYWQTVTVEELVGELENPYIRHMAFAADGRLAVGLVEHVVVCEVRVYDIPERSILESEYAMPMDENALGGIAWSPTGFYLAAVADAGMLRVWGKQGLHIQMVVDSDEVGTALSAVAFSSDRKLLIAGGNDGSIHMWRKGRGVEDDWILTKTVKVEGSDAVLSVACQSGGEFVATGEGGVVRVWKYVI